MHQVDTLVPIAAKTRLLRDHLHLSFLAACGDIPDLCGSCHKTSLRRRSALPMTETDERLMAALAIMGDSSRPNTG